MKDRGVYNFNGSRKMNFKTNSNSKSEGGLAVLGCLGITALVLAIIFIEPLIVWFVWSAVLVPTFGFPELSFWAVFGILIVLNIIGGCFKSTIRTNNN